MREILSPKFVENETKPGRYGDGGSLYLLIKPGGHKTWVFRWRDRVTKKLRDKGLGPYGKRDVTLSKARDLAGVCREQVRDGGDPIAISRELRADAIAAYKNLYSFKDCATRYIDTHKAGWRNKKHTAQWTSSLNKYADPLMKLSVNEITTDHVLQCLDLIWTTKTETATRVRQRIENVLGWATVRKYRTGDNPARWKGHLDQLLPSPAKLKKIKHRPALDYHQAYDFMVKLRAVDSQAAHAIELQLLTASRPGETVGARWSEFDLDNKAWVIPAERMKANIAHTIPLSVQAINLLKRLTKISDLVFPGRTLEQPMTTAAGMKLLKRIEPGITAHGFRSTFRDWAADKTSHTREVCEAALAHQLKDKAEAAYFRSDQLVKRSKLMKDWANYCDRQPDKSATITDIREAAKS